MGSGQLSIHLHLHLHSHLHSHLHLHLHLHFYMSSLTPPPSGSLAASSLIELMSPELDV